MAKFRIRRRHYDSTLGKLYNPGSIVEIPDDLKPARDWIPVEEDEEVTPVQKTAGETLGGRQRTKGRKPIGA